MCKACVSNKMKNRNDVIAVVRVTAMLMIIGCHLSSWLGINALAMILNVGVYIFLLISGMLYSNKSIDKGYAFMKMRWLKLCIPMYCLLGFLMIYRLAFGLPLERIKNVCTYILNLQGIGFIVPIAIVGQIKGMEHLWFLSAIVLCYILLLIVKKYETENFWNKQINANICLIVFILIDIVMAFQRVSLQYFLTFFIGYAMGKRVRRYSVTRYMATTGAMLIAMIVRLLGRYYIDGTVVYDSLIVSFTHIVLTIWVYRTIEFVAYQKPQIMSALSKNKAMHWMEKHSLYLYMTHYMFLAGPLYISHLPIHTTLQVIVFVLCTVVSSVVLRFISEKVIWIFCGNP